MNTEPLVGNRESRNHIEDISRETGELFNVVKVSRKTIPVTGSGSLSGYEILRIPHCLGNRLKDGGKVVSPTNRPRSIPQKNYFSASGTHFCE
jgi:hypothetical protein